VVLLIAKVNIVLIDWLIYFEELFCWLSIAMGNSSLDKLSCCMYFFKIIFPKGRGIRNLLDAVQNYGVFISPRC
jgi:hypothetical protein